MTGLPVHHQLPEFTQTHVHRVHDAIQPPHPLSSPSPTAPNPSPDQSLSLSCGLCWVILLLLLLFVLFCFVLFVLFVCHPWPLSKGQFSSVQFSCSVMSNSLRHHESRHTRPPCPSPTPGVRSNSRPSSWWCHPATSSSVVPFSSCPQSRPASESFPMSQLFA